MQKYDAIFVSPHFDDAILSAGNRIHSLVKRGKKTLVVTIFTKGSGTTQKAASHFLQNCHYSSASKLFHDRAIEDRQAVATIGCDCHHFNYIDAGFRNDHPTFDTIFNDEPTENDKNLLEKVIHSLKTFIDSHAKNHTQLYFPIGVGKHIDHHLVFLAACRLWNPNSLTKLLFWEDIPYRNQTGATLQRLATINSVVSGMTTEILASSGTTKYQAIAAYNSQLTGLSQVGGLSMPFDLKIERFWHG